uniref:Uncharacterized protein n=1 Tax=Glossina palpalis gambiensis TaxID=67801 RepID=A0A1B0BSW2_9MUSC
MNNSPFLVNNDCKHPILNQTSLRMVPNILATSAVTERTKELISKFRFLIYNPYRPAKKEVLSNLTKTISSPLPNENNVTWKLPQLLTLNVTIRMKRKHLEDL